VRNYEARNTLRDVIRVGDRAFFYHGRVPPLAIVGTVEVVMPAYPDPTAFDPSDHHYDPKSSREHPIWYAVDVKLVQRFPEAVSRDDLKACAALNAMLVLKRGSRLSVQPVTLAEWKAVHRLAGVKEV
jgi:predicted RNA-binding protein with PUA-like domain